MNKEQLANLLNQDLGLEIESFDKLERLMSLTLKVNEQFNLTAIKDEDKFRELMIYDSLIPLRYVDLNNKSVIDVGTGAGFPGLPLAICSSGKFTLLDSTNKKISHICHVIDELNINNVTPICARSEEYARKNLEGYDYAIARAVASLNVLAELTLPLVKLGGYLIAMKGAKGEEEIKDANKMIAKLGGEVNKVIDLELPENKEKRTIILIKKIGHTPKKYPRDYSEIVRK